MTTTSGLPPVRASLYLNGTLAHVAEIADGPGPIPTEVDEGSLATSVNAVVPAEVVRPGLEMVVEIDPDGTLDSGLGVARRIPEMGRAAVDVRAVPLLDLTLVPFLWAADPDSAILEPVVGMAADPEGHELLGFMRMLLPVGDLDVKAHEPVLSSSNDGFELVEEVRAIRVMEGGSGYWMGHDVGVLRYCRHRHWGHRPGRGEFRRSGQSTGCRTHPSLRPRHRARVRPQLQPWARAVVWGGYPGLGVSEAGRGRSAYGDTTSATAVWYRQAGPT